VDAGPHGSQQDRADPHGWNSVENFLYLHEKYLAEHPFVDHGTSDTLVFERFELHGTTYFSLSGQVYCHHGVIVDVAKYYESRVVGGRDQMRGFSYRYNAHVRNGHNVLRYDNGHPDAPEEFHRHRFDPATGEEIERHILTRHELPVFSVILDELQEVFEGDRS